MLALDYPVIRAWLLPECMENTLENHEPGDHQEDVEDQGGDEHVDEVIQVVGEGSGGEVCMAGESEDGVLEHWESLFNSHKYFVILMRSLFSV